MKTLVQNGTLNGQLSICKQIANEVLFAQNSYREPEFIIVNQSGFPMIQSRQTGTLVVGALELFMVAKETGFFCELSNKDYDLTLDMLSELINI